MTGLPDEEQAKRALLRHAIATLAYRGAKALRGAEPSFADFHAGSDARTPLQLVAHLGDLFDWALTMAQGDQKWNPAAPTSWSEESTRFFVTLGRLDEFLASDRILGCPVERLFQGPVADALTHVGQLMMLRRLSRAPVRSENYAIAAIAAGRLTPDQPPPKFEFD
jgi:hypothetical protein